MNESSSDKTRTVTVQQPLVGFTFAFKYPCTHNRAFYTCIILSQINHLTILKLMNCRQRYFTNWTARFNVTPDT